MGQISRRRLFQAAGSASMLAVIDAATAESVPSSRMPASVSQQRAAWDSGKLAAPFIRDPIRVYDNWSAYAEGIQGLSATRLTEDLAMRQLDQVVRYKRLGVHFDYYMMNAFWFAPDGAYRHWRKPDWPNGPDRWIAECQRHALKPGLWFGSNTLWQIEPAPQWMDSLALSEHPTWSFRFLSFHKGGFLADFMAVVQSWYDRGIRMFEFDMANFDARTAEERESDTAPAEVRVRNERAFSNALKAFRRRNPDALLVAFNDFGGDIKSTTGPFPFKKPVDLRWLEVFDTMYSGDTRASDVPQASFWRSVDMYNDHMVRRYEQSGVPLERIDPFFTLSSTWFGYSRGKRAWKGMLLLSLARGSWKQTIYGSLELLNDEEVHWFSKAQGMFAPLLAMGRTKTFGGIPGEAQPYGFGSFDVTGALYTLVNPAQDIRTVELPLLSAVQDLPRDGRIIFRDAGFAPRLQGQKIVLGPGQMAVVGFGRFAAAEHDLGVQDDVVIPRAIRPLPAQFVSTGSNSLQTTFVAPLKGNVRVFFQQRDRDGAVLKSHKIRGRIEAQQQGAPVAVDVDLKPDVEGFAGVSWAAGEIQQRNLVAKKVVTVRYALNTDQPAMLQGQVFVVEY